MFRDGLKLTESTHTEKGFFEAKVHRISRQIFVLPAVLIPISNYDQRACVRLSVKDRHLSVPFPFLRTKTVAVYLDYAFQVARSPSLAPDPLRRIESSGDSDSEPALRVVLRVAQSGSACGMAA